MAVKQTCPSAGLWIQQLELFLRRRRKKPRKTRTAEIKADMKTFKTMTLEEIKGRLGDVVREKMHQNLGKKQRILGLSILWENPYQSILKQLDKLHQVESSLWASFNISGTLRL